jgi:hypothetical protein
VDVVVIATTRTETSPPYQGMQELCVIDEPCVSLKEAMVRVT